MTVKEFIKKLAYTKHMRIDTTHPAYHMAKMYTSPSRHVKIYGVVVSFEACNDGTFIASTK